VAFAGVGCFVFPFGRGGVSSSNLSPPSHPFLLRAQAAAREKVKHHAFLMKRACDVSGSGSGASAMAALSAALPDVLRHATLLVGELRTGSLTPKVYYELYMDVFDALTFLETHFSALQVRARGARSAAMRGEREEVGAARVSPASCRSSCPTPPRAPAPIRLCAARGRAAGARVRGRAADGQRACCRAPRRCGPRLSPPPRRPGHRALAAHTPIPRRCCRGCTCA